MARTKKPARSQPEELRSRSLPPARVLVGLAHLRSGQRAGAPVPGEPPLRRATADDESGKGRSSSGDSSARGTTRKWPRTRSCAATSLTTSRTSLSTTTSSKRSSRKRRVKSTCANSSILPSCRPSVLERGYYLTPAKEATKAYRLLAEVMERTRRAGVATFVMREREYLVAIFARGGVLCAETLRFHDEIRDPQSIGLPEPAPAAAAARVGVRPLHRRSLRPGPCGATSLPTRRLEALKAIIDKKTQSRSRPGSHRARERRGADVERRRRRRRSAGDNPAKPATVGRSIAAQCARHDEAPSPSPARAGRRT